jgi:hypothetical protein
LESRGEGEGDREREEGEGEEGMSWRVCGGEEENMSKTDSTHNHIYYLLGTI